MRGCRRARAHSALGSARIEGTMKYSHHFGNRPDEVFDVAADHLERDNLISRVSPSRIRAMQAEALAWRVEVGPTTPRPAVPGSPNGQYRQLGHRHFRAATVARAGGAAPRPRCSGGDQVVLDPHPTGTRHIEDPITSNGDRGRGRSVEAPVAKVSTNSSSSELRETTGASRCRSAKSSSHRYSTTTGPEPGLYPLSWHCTQEISWVKCEIPTYTWELTGSRGCCEGQVTVMVSPSTLTVFAARGPGAGCLTTEPSVIENWLP